MILFLFLLYISAIAANIVNIIPLNIYHNLFPAPPVSGSSYATDVLHISICEFIYYQCEVIQFENEIINNPYCENIRDISELENILKKIFNFESGDINE